MSRHCAIALVFIATGLGQSLADAVLSGRVTDSQTHQPIAGARMWADPEVRTTTDADGTYSMRIPVQRDPAATMLWVDKAGYAPSRPQQAVMLKPGAVTKNDVELNPAATIAGRLVDRDSDRPLGGFLVRLIPGGDTPPVSSDADGRFTYADLAPGDYALEFMPPLSQDKVGYADAWYPGVDRPDMAAKITLTPGAARALEVRLLKRELHTLGGTVKAPEGFSGEITVVPVNLNRKSVTFNRKIDATKPFRLDGFAEGSYSLLLNAGNLFGQKTVDVRDRDIEDLVIALQPGVSVKASIAMEEKDARPPAPENMFFNLMPLDGWDLTVDGQDRPDQMSANGIPHGRHWPFLLFIQPTPAVPNYAVTSVSYGNRDVTNQPIDIESPDPTVTFTLTSRPGSITGRLQDSNSNPLPDCLILAFSSSLLDAMPPDQFDFLLPRLPPMGAATTASDGSYRMRILAPGKYKVLILTGADKNRRTDPAVLREGLASAETVTVEAGQTANFDLKTPR